MKFALFFESVKTKWDYSERAHTYDKRADYSESAVIAAIKHTGLDTDTCAADIGAGTGKLTKLLVTHFSRIFAIEPNSNMRHYGQINVSDETVTWSAGSAESTELHPNSVDAVYFGSSFNVVEPKETIVELVRISKPGGWFTCMWNHRDTNDVIQSEIEALIRSKIPDFDYGIRRKDPTNFLDSTGIFRGVTSIEDSFTVQMSNSDVVDAWRSHETLFRQSGNRFDELISDIAEMIPEEGIFIPYFTRIWVSQLK